MKKGWLVIAIIIICLILISYSIGYKADKDHEFVGGSKIEYINLSEDKVDDLVLLGKIWGYLKYYHPNVAAGKYNWDYELFRILPDYLDANTPNEIDKILLTWIDDLGKFELVDPEKERPGEIKMSPNLDWISNSSLSTDLILKLSDIKNAKRTSKHYYVDLAMGVGNPQFKNEGSYSSTQYPDAGYRLLSLYRYWNIIEYYFPYKYLIDDNWDDVLHEFIPKLIEASDELEYKLSILELVTRVKDTHANVWDNTLENHWGEYYAPLEITFVEDKAIVTDYHDIQLGEASGLKIGDIITRVNGKSVEEIINERLKYTPASNYPTQIRNIAANLLRGNTTYLKIEYIRDEKVDAIDILCYSSEEMTIENRFQKNKDYFKRISPEIAYIYMGALKSKDIPDIMEEIKDTNGLVIDLRSYPLEFAVFKLGEYLMPQGTDFVKFSNGSITDPGLFTMTNTLKVGKENKDYYKGKVVILVNELTLSQAEYTAMAFRVAPRATVIGSTTAGADGNVSTFNLPGGITTAISGIGVYYPDGGETQRIGIVPDIEVKPTIEGIKSNRDELLEKAIEVINQQ
ncbi:S41 family peptidase [Alkaliphilus peptidifermentans]|uniref:Peptidase family S41 n=1 Tax=Alkaliphilus peptidifermentans DSM 18978 TaxID=1120976 RepID=A0A1G5GHZ3_9FIRM|nr:S41 family peptidase [Alkaliphilus peptidifermentans]SCY50991.1 Peptidase family S41 [Alkaliphilus peptidifermentans DSM 18978]